MRKLLLILFLAGTVWAQEFGSWKNFTDMEVINNFVFNSNSLSAATTGGLFIFSPSDSTYKTYTKSEGLKSQSITAIAMDSAGKIWIGSEEGFIHIVNPEDNSVEVIRDIYATEKTLKSINYIAISSDTVFVCTDFGLSLIDANSYIFIDTILKFGNLPAETKVNSVYMKNRIYVATDLGMAISKSGASNLTAPESWNSFSKSSGLNADKVFSINYHNGIIAGTDNGIFKFDGTNWTSFISLNENVNSLLSYNNNLYYTSLKDTLTTHIVTKFRRFDGSKNYIIKSNLDETYTSLQSKDDNIYLGTSKGIMEFNNNKLQRTIKPNGMVQNSVHRIAVDKFGNLWTVSGKSDLGSGINFFDGKAWKNFNKNNLSEINSNAFYGVYPDKDGRVYFGHWGKGIVVYDDGNFEFYTSKNTNLTGIKENLNYIVITDLEKDDKGNLWVTNSETASSETINVFTPDSQEYNYRVRTGITPVDAESFNIAIDQYGTKWFNIVSAVSGAIGLYYFRDGGTLDNISDDRWGVLTTTSGLNSNTINDIVLDKRGELWVGTSLGVNIIPNPGSPTSGISSSFPIRQQNIICIAVDPLNRKWVGTNEGAFLVSSDGSLLLENFKKENSPLPSNTVKSIAINENTGMVYFATDFGISSYLSSSVKPNETYDELFVYPNPVRLSAGSPVNITIDGLIKESTLKILTVSGDLVKKVTTPGGRVAFWDGRDESGNLVPSGVYIIVAYDVEANAVAHTKVAIIRE